MPTYSNRTFNVTQNLSLETHNFVKISYDANNYILGQVVSYTPSTGVLIVTPSSSVGSGTYNSWTVSLIGFSGSSGTSGTSGNSLAAGSAGTGGTSGVSGTNGTSGTNGSNGTSGTSASSGSSGTSASSGTAGVQGTSGTNGTSGTVGKSATNGTSGTSGLIGVYGSAGGSGVSRSSGTSGTSGSSGVTGPTGAQGPAGAAGGQGPAGAKGTSGSSGGTGPTGPQGPQGPTGPTGIQPASAPTGGAGGTGATGSSASYNQDLNSGAGPVVYGTLTGSAYLFTYGRYYTAGDQGKGIASNVAPTWQGFGFGWATSAALGGTYFFNPSLRELKKDIEPFKKSAMDILNATEIVSYKLDSGVHDDVTLIGFIAENTPAELATEQHDKMDNTNTLSVILKAIQEIDDRIIALQNKKNAIR
jgi:hypothetical protein